MAIGYIRLVQAKKTCRDKRSSLFFHIVYDERKVYLPDTSGLYYKHIMTIVTDNCKWRLYYKCVTALALAKVWVTLQIMASLTDGSTGREVLLKGRLSMADLLVLTSLDQFLFIWKILFTFLQNELL